MIPCISNNCSRLLAVFILLLYSRQAASSELNSQTFDLPSLILRVDQLYLVRKTPTVLKCEISAGYSEARLESIVWLKNGETIQEIVEKHPSKNDYEIQGNQLTIVGGKQQSEGDYQCSADIVHVQLTNRHIVNTKLVSAPVQLRRARITKFDRTSEHLIRVRLGEVARLPCAGMPDVVPGPPEICFEKEGTNGCIGEKGEESNFLATSSGMQIAMTQPTDKGNYYCVVRNEYTNMTRKSTTPAILIVDPMPSSNDTDDTPPTLTPTLVYPVKPTTIEKPINIDVVEGNEVLLECVFSEAKVVWTKPNGTMPPISLTDDNAQYRQLYGNLRIQDVTINDSGIFSCVGVSALEQDPDVNNPEYPRVYYNLIVHAPTDVDLRLERHSIEKSIWVLSCKASNLRYEIPMVYVNGTPLIDAIDQMGLPTNTNFYTNPVNVTLHVKQDFSGSVQCISRPAMEEAEIYGRGLERGRSKNIFVMSNRRHAADDLISQGPENATAFIGDTIDLPCLVQRAKQKYWLKGDEFVKIFDPRSRTRSVGSNTLRISNVQPEDEGWYTCVVIAHGSHQSKAAAYLKVVSRSTEAPTDAPTTEQYAIVKKEDDSIAINDIAGFVTGSNIRVKWTPHGSPEALGKIAKIRIEFEREGSEKGWMEADIVEGHVRATTIRDLVPNNRYKFRVEAVRLDNSKVASNSTDWMMLQLPIGDVLPIEPKIADVTLVSTTSAVVVWTHEAPIPNAAARNFVVIYTRENMDAASIENDEKKTKTLKVQVDGNNTETELTDLEVDQIYTVNVYAENNAGKSPLSTPYILNTTAPEMASGIGTTMSKFGDSIMNMSIQTVALVLAGVFMALLVLLICCVVFCNLSHEKKAKSGPNGKFLDASYRIFNEQKVHKSRMYNDTPGSNLYCSDEIDECSPLKKQDPKPENDGADRFQYKDTINVYGNLGDDDMPIPMEEVAPEPTYAAAKLLGSGLYSTTTARCYSPDSGTSHEMIMPYGTILSGSTPTHQLTSSSPQRVIAYKCPDSLLYSPAGTASSLADTSSSGVHVARLNTDSPTNPTTDGSERSHAGGDSSRNSQISSSDGVARIPMATFKSTSPHTTSFVSGTFDRRNHSPKILSGIE